MTRISLHSMRTGIFNLIIKQTINNGTQETEKLSAICRNICRNTIRRQFIKLNFFCNLFDQSMEAFFRMGKGRNG
jgi:hypothetical protein